MAGSFHYSQDKYGVPGKALASRRSCFNMNICSKAISSGGHVADGRETNPLFPRDNISGMHVEDNLVTQEANIFVMHDDGTEATLVIQGETISEMHVADGTEATPLAAQLWINSMMHVDDGIEATPLVPQGENVSTMHVAGGTGPITERESICSTKSPMGQLEGNKFHIGLDELKLHFRKRLDEAAKDLGVSRSTLKRIRKSCGIQRWPSHKKNKVNQSLFMKENLKHAPHTGEDIMVGSSGTDSTHPVLPMPTRIHSTHDIHTDQHQTVSEVDRFVAIKASHRDVMLKFLLNSRSSLKDLQKEVAKRLKLQAGRCNMKYQDEDGDCISITIDEDLQRCLQSFVVRNQTTIRMSVHLN
ncbi:hypothetical protein LIER_40133 [Lithospermum erythrorhizon]|uniref:Uncharacterized protein n=1 Tax=Lithospermum erythrorhizon TaxID=34254 RepID=A0AAV3QSI2_LITER